MLRENKDSGYTVVLELNGANIIISRYYYENSRVRSTLTVRLSGRKKKILTYIYRWEKHNTTGTVSGLNVNHEKIIEHAYKKIREIYREHS